MIQKETKVEARTIAKATSHEGKAGATETQKDGMRELVKRNPSILTTLYAQCTGENAQS